MMILMAAAFAVGCGDDGAGDDLGTGTGTGNGNGTSGSIFCEANCNRASECDDRVDRGLCIEGCERFDPTAGGDSEACTSAAEDAAACLRNADCGDFQSGDACQDEIGSAGVACATGTNGDNPCDCSQCGNPSLVGLCETAGAACAGSADTTQCCAAAIQACSS